MTEPYLIAIDLDGTLLNDEKMITKKTMHALSKAQKDGHKVVISTGRPYRASQACYEALSLDTPIVNFNGAFVHHPLDPNWEVFHAPLELKTAKTIIKTCEAFNVKNIIVEVVDHVYFRYHDEFIVETFGAGEPIFNTGDLNELLNDPPTSVVIYPNGNARELQALIEQAPAEAIEQRSWGAPYDLIEIVKGGINKSVGLKRVAESYGIPQDHIVAFGDEDNDLEMIRWAGHGVAMGNAIEELKDIANTVTHSNNEDGIAEYLQEILI